MMSRSCVWDVRSFGLPRVGCHPRVRNRRQYKRRSTREDSANSSPDSKEENPPISTNANTPPTPQIEEAFAESPSVQLGSVRHSGLRGNPLSCGVESATINFELPPPAAAARNLVEQAHYAHLCTVMSNKHHRRAGYPFGTVVDFVSDGSGFPILRLSSLAVPTRNVLENPKCSVVVQMPGWSGLANARVTIFGDVYQITTKLEDMAKELFQGRNSKEDNILSGNSLYFRMHEIKDIFFVGGFGTVQWINVQDYIDAQPDEINSVCTPSVLQSLNQEFCDGLRRLLSRRSPVHEATLISIDSLGADIRTRTGGEFGVVRIGFPTKVQTINEVKDAFGEILGPVNRIK